jgi:CheY-like chemotaxis protein
MKARVLVADDSATIQKVVELTLGRVGVELVKARSADEALRKVKEQRPDLMLIDHTMPDRSGKDLCVALRKDSKLKDVPIILMAGPSQPVDAADMRRIGITDVVTKPFDSQTLIGKVKQLLLAPGPQEVEPAAARPPEDEDALVLESPGMGEGIRLPAELMDRSAVQAAPEPLLESIPTYDLSEDTTELPLGPPLREEVDAAPTRQVGDLGIEDMAAAVGLDVPTSRPRSQPRPAPPLAAPQAGRDAQPMAVGGSQTLAVPPELVQTLAHEVAERVATHMVRELRTELLERVDRLLWEVVPDLAEQLITQEIRRIRELVEGKQ